MAFGSFGTEFEFLHAGDVDAEGVTLAGTENLGAVEFFAIAEDGEDGGALAGGTIAEADDGAEGLPAGGEGESKARFGVRVEAFLEYFAGEFQEDALALLGHEPIAIAGDFTPADFGVRPLGIGKVNIFAVGFGKVDGSGFGFGEGAQMVQLAAAFFGGCLGDGFRGEQSFGLGGIAHEHLFRRGDQPVGGEVVGFRDAFPIQIEGDFFR